MKPLVQIIAGLSLVVLTGCVGLIVPVPASGKKVAFGQRIQTNDLAFVQVGKTTRQECQSKIGVPWTHYTDLHVSVYYWEMLTGYWVWGWIFPGGIAAVGNGGKDEITRTHVLFVEFTEDDRVRRFQILPHPKKMTTKDAAAGWLRSP
jgi:hypothetical protein